RGTTIAEVALSRGLRDVRGGLRVPAARCRGLHPPQRTAPEDPRPARSSLVPRTVDVVLTADAVTPARLRDASALVIDVLRASTSIVTALGSGAAAVVPVETVEEARAHKVALGPGTLLAGERDSDPPEGFDLGNSPREFTPERVRDRTIVLTTSNGTRALTAARPAAAVAVAAFVNAAAAVAWARGHGGNVVLVCAGSLGTPSLEDQACAGWLAG